MAEVLVLCYHAVSGEWPAELALPAPRLREQLERLVSRGYQGVTFSEAMQGDGAGRRLAVTFDDAYRSVLDEALPILSRLGLPGTVFAPTDFLHRAGPMSWPGIDRWLGGPHERELEGMGGEGLVALRDAGWEVGSHTCSHPVLTALGDRELERELSDSRARLEELLGVPCRSLAYPYGAADARVARGAARAGYSAAGTLAPFGGGADPLLWRRVGVYRGDTTLRFSLKVSRIARRAELGRLRHPLRALTRRA